MRIWPPDGATCITCKYGQQMAPFTLVANLASRWRHLHKLQIWPPDGTTCIDSKVGHQVMSHALPHCLGLPYWHYQLVLSLYLHQLESHQLSFKKVCELVRDNRIHRSDQGHLGPIKSEPFGQSGILFIYNLLLPKCLHFDFGSKFV